MSPSVLPAHLLPASTVFLLLTLLTAPATAQAPTNCPLGPNGETQSIVYSPFTPYFRGLPTYNSSQQCWLWASCTLSNADPARQQQFGAVALVMGLIPLTFKDIAWPGRRVVRLSRKLPWGREVGVRALGLEPRYPEGRGAEAVEELRLTRDEWNGSMVAKRAAKPGWWVVGMCVPLVAAMGGLAVVEIYSKRASLGCVYPVFVVSWFVVGLLPAALHRVCYDIRTRAPEQGQEEVETAAVMAARREPASQNGGVQGSDEIWLVQLMWAVYYVTGTLIYTSIMAVTVVELTVWVFMSAFCTACCKFLAFFICLQWEKKQQTFPSDAPARWQTVQPLIKSDAHGRLP